MIQETEVYNSIFESRNSLANKKQSFQVYDEEILKFKKLKRKLFDEMYNLELSEDYILLSKTKQTKQISLLMNLQDNVNKYIQELRILKEKRKILLSKQVKDSIYNTLVENKGYTSLILQRLKHVGFLYT